MKTMIKAVLAVATFAGTTLAQQFGTEIASTEFKAMLDETAQAAPAPAVKAEQPRLVWNIQYIHDSGIFQKTTYIGQGLPEIVFLYKSQHGRPMVTLAGKKVEVSFTPGFTTLRCGNDVYAEVEGGLSLNGQFFEFTHGRGGDCVNGMVIRTTESRMSIIGNLSADNIKLAAYSEIASIMSDYMPPEKPKLAWTISKQNRSVVLRGVNLPEIRITPTNWTPEITINGVKAVIDIRDDEHFTLRCGSDVFSTGMRLNGKALKDLETPGNGTVAFNGFMLEIKKSAVKLYGNMAPENIKAAAYWLAVLMAYEALDANLMR